MEFGDEPILPSVLIRASGITQPERYDLIALPASRGDLVLAEVPTRMSDGAQFITARKSTSVA